LNNLSFVINLGLAGGILYYLALNVLGLHFYAGTGSTKEFQVWEN